MPAMLYSPGEVRDWYGDDDNRRHHEMLRDRQILHLKTWDVGVRRATRSYNLGMVTLAAGIGVCPAPRHGVVGDAAVQWTATSLMWSASAAGAVWTYLAERSGARENRHSGQP